MNKILVIEDDVVLCNSIKDLLEREGFQVDTASNIADATPKCSLPDIILLDWRLPDGQGIDLLKDLRKKEILTPIIMLTAKSELIDKILGLESGANDYITKPFEPPELLARIRVQLRITPQAPEQSNTPTSIDGLTIDPESREVTYNDAKINLTKLEYNLLSLLFNEPNRVFSRDEILNKVWGYENYPTTRTVDTHILQLRQKISKDFFETLRGVGYRFYNTKT